MVAAQPEQPGGMLQDLGAGLCLAEGGGRQGDTNGMIFIISYDYHHILASSEAGEEQERQWRSYHSPP